MSEVHVKGLAELNAYLKALPEKIEKNVMRGALRAGANVLRDAARANAPVGPPNARDARRYGNREGTLRDSIRVSTRASGGVVTATISAGGRSKNGGDAYYARWIEFGTAAHLITAKAGKWLAFGGRFFKAVRHPGTRPRAFMRPAIDTQAQAAVIAAGEYIKKRLATKHGIDTGDVVIEGDE